ncbi:Uncharacterised protein [Candidatus Ornithobacterium hominis]|uniref:Uncharacterized protein n=1 Tax=Candidatus Ornithobacterium hominis TaxID=2497989 RepID=A0A383U3I7_9FLAO|nr:hypothetical protein [Candidatus Ornithobacterium hominis]MCT7904706.1 hypothetical protein [Candidatus Ornithobacterium hominis]SZD73949.1 Uncharacterised protein [Candidatus Ornithobacterium hominis]
MKSDNLNLVELNSQELRTIDGGMEKIGDQLYRLKDGRYVYFGNNGLVYAGVALRNAVLTVASWF